jgi:hypothetical protein
MLACYLRDRVISIKTGPKECFQPQSDMRPRSPQLRRVGAAMVRSLRLQKRMYRADIEVGDRRGNFGKAISNRPSDQRGEVLRNSKQGGSIALTFVEGGSLSVRLLVECSVDRSMKLLAIFFGLPPGDARNGCTGGYHDQNRPGQPEPSESLVFAQARPVRGRRDGGGGMNRPNRKWLEG